MTYKRFHIFITLGKVSPLAYLVAYLCMVPAYALLYRSFCEGGFYAQFAHLEPEWINEGEVVSKIVEHSLKNENRLLPFTTVDKSATVDNISVITAYTSDGVRLNLVVAFRTINDQKNPSTTIDQVRNLYTSLDSAFTADLLLANSPMFARLAGLAPLPPGFKRVAIYDSDTATDRQIWGHLEFILPEWITISNNDFGIVKAYLELYAGLGRNVTNNIWRMMYLSSVIITTLGLGDIVPLTGTARVLVAVEAISGIVLAGLFLNALSYQASRPP